MAKQTTVHAEVDRATKSAIQRKAKDSKVSVSVIVRWAIQEYLERQSKEQVIDNGSVDWTLEGLQKVLNVPRVPGVPSVPEPKRRKS